MTEEDTKAQATPPPTSASPKRGPTAEGILAKLDRGFPDGQRIPEQIARVKARYLAIIENDAELESE
jgi:hypothetical protein